MIDKDRALEAVEFVQQLKLTDDFYGKPFVLQDWQHEILWDVYGTVTEDGRRQYRTAYLEIPKKNGKTTLIGAVGLYHLVCDPPGGQIYCCAAEKEQAGLVYRAAKHMIEQDDALSEMIKVVDSKKEIHNRRTGTYLKVLSAEAYSKHGLNPSVVIFDELHAQPNRDLWDTMYFGAGSARREPLLWVITTAGDDPDRHSIGWEIHELAQKIIDKEVHDPTWYARIYGAPEDADIYDENTWYNANPSLGVSIQIETVRKEALSARNSEPTERLFRWLRLNQWMALKRISWLPLSLWDQCQGELTPADLVGKRCYAGLDLSSVGDLTAVGLVFPPQEGLDDFYIMTEQWIPQENMKQRVIRDRIPYDRFAKDGYLHLTPGDVIDYDFIKARLIALNQQYEIAGWGNDPWGAEKLRQDLERDADIELLEVKQNIQNMNGPMKEIERLMKIGHMKHVHNPLTRWAFGNVNVVMDGNGNYKPKKLNGTERIDPIVAVINAMYICLKLEEGETRTREVIAI